MTRQDVEGSGDLAELLRDLEGELGRIATDSVGALLGAAVDGDVDAPVLRRIDRSLIDLEQIIELLMELDSVAAGGTAMSTTEVDLRLLVDAVIETSAGDAPVEHLPGPPVWVRGDARYLGVALSAMLDAASRGSPGRARIVVRTTHEGDRAGVTMIVPTSTLRAGLAMQLAHRTARIHGGTAACRELLGITRLSIDLPAARRYHRLPPGMSILLVDDNADHLRALAELLRRDGVAIECATSGGEALDAMQQRMPDVLVVDVQMPDIDGMEVIRRARERKPALPVVLLTGYPPDHPMVIGATTDGRSAYVAKPINVDALRSAVAKALQAPSEPARR